jgi:energy-coupling factor transporter ATP-binding protein EcfA2
MLRISSFSIKGLNDLYNYENCSIDDPESSLLILYGDNGSGKTTILNLVFHMLSGKDRAGHMNAIARVPFKSIQIHLSDGTIVSAERINGVNSVPLLFKLKRPNLKALEYMFVPEKLRERFYNEFLENQLSEVKSSNKNKNKSSVSRAIDLYSHTSLSKDEITHTAYIEAVQGLGITCYFMATDRRMQSDIIEDKRPNGRQVFESENNNDDVISKVRTLYLKDALGSASRYINRQIIRASNTGSKNTNDIYAELIDQISQEVKAQDSINITDAMNKLISLAKQSGRFSDLGLSPALDFSAIQSSIENSPTTNIPLLHKILLPYIDSLNARFSALQPVTVVIETFLNLLNDLFKHKSVTFSPTDGFVIYGPISDIPLDTDQLSSGEQQLLLMFCYLLISNGTNSIFMIDEPEISLNVKWQRELIDAMRKITNNSQTQIIMATHSIELLSQYSDMVIPLDPTISKEKIFKNVNSEKND